MCSSSKGDHMLKNETWRASLCKLTGQFLRQAAENGRGVPVLGRAEGVLLCYG